MSMAAAASARGFLSKFLSPSLLRPLASSVVTGSLLLRSLPPAAQVNGIRRLSSQLTTSSLRDSSPNWSNRPPKETILLDGCDFEHWLVVVDPPPGNNLNPDPPREEIIDGYIKTLAAVVGSEEEARKKIYSVSTRCYFAFGALVSEEVSYKIKELPNVRWVLPDSYLDVRNKDYGGEPFINGEAVPYDPKYHDEWIRNNARSNERSRRNDRPRNFDRSRNFERRRENMPGGFQNQNAPNMAPNTPPNMPPNTPPNMPPNMSPPPTPPPQYNAHSQGPPPPPQYPVSHQPGSGRPYDGTNNQPPHNLPGPPPPQFHYQGQGNQYSGNNMQPPPQYPGAPQAQYQGPPQQFHGQSSHFNGPAPQGPASSFNNAQPPQFQGNSVPPPYQGHGAHSNYPPNYQPRDIPGRD